MVLALAGSPADAQQSTKSYLYRITVPLTLDTGLDPIHHRLHAVDTRRSRDAVRSEALTTYRLSFDMFLAEYLSWGLRFVSTGSVYRHLGEKEDVNQVENFYQYQFDDTGSYKVSGEGRLQVEYKSFGAQLGSRLYLLRSRSRSHEIFVSGHLGVHFWLRLEGQNYQTYEANENTDLEINGISPYVGVSLVYTNFFGLGVAVDVDYYMFGGENFLLFPGAALLFEPVKIYQVLFSTL